MLSKTMRFTGFGVALAAGLFLSAPSAKAQRGLEFGVGAAVGALVGAAVVGAAAQQQQRREVVVIERERRRPRVVREQPRRVVAQRQVARQTPRTQRPAVTRSRDSLVQPTTGATAGRDPFAGR